MPKNRELDQESIASGWRELGLFVLGATVGGFARLLREKIVLERGQGKRGIYDGPVNGKEIMKQVEQVEPLESYTPTMEEAKQRVRGDFY